MREGPGLATVSGAALGVGSAGATARAEHPSAWRLSRDRWTHSDAQLLHSHLATMSLFTLLDQADEGMGILACQ